MDCNRIAGTDVYAGLIQQTCSLLNCSLPDIRERYADYPYCLIEYCERDITENSIEIRFDKEEITISCILNPEGKCNYIYLFPDKYEMVEELILYLKDGFDYDFIKNRWSTEICYIVTREMTEQTGNVCFVFFS